MKKTMLVLALFAAPLFAQPRIVHGTLTTVGAAADLGGQIRRSTTPWIGYAVPQIGGYREMCCFNNYGNVRYGGTCRLGGEGSFFNNSDDDGPSADTFVVLYRVANGAVDSVRSYSIDCRLDADGQPVTWIENVNPRASVDFLSSLATSGQAGKRAVAALALHAEPHAAEALESLIRSSAADELRGDAIFWMAITRGMRALEPARALLRDASSTDRLREKAVFALSQIDDPAAVDELIRVARNDARSSTRGKALFWLSQKAGRKAADALRDAADNDPEAEVRAKAVFGISQLPNDQSIPMLIDLMKRNRSPEVRKKAAFWLGQKNDPRALAAIEDLLKQ